MNSLARQKAEAGEQQAEMWEQYNPDGIGEPINGITGDFSTE